jgi:hypothetical protein
MIEHPQRLSYNTVKWTTIKLKVVFDRVCKNSIFDLSSGDAVFYDVDYYRMLKGNGYVKDTDLWIFWMKHEAYLPFETDIKNLHKVCEELNLDESKVVFINGDMNLSKNYNKWFKKSGFNKPINCIGFPWYFLHDREDLKTNPYKFIKYQDREVQPSKKFICLNGTYNKSRDYIINKLDKFKNDGYLSNLSKGIKLDKISIDKLVGQDRNDEPSVFLLNDFHQDSFFSIINEAGGGWEAFDQDDIHSFLTEKITKPLYYGHPFILIGWKNSLKFLKEMGFETYDDIFDLTYDGMETWKERTVSAWKQIEKILSLPDDDFYHIFEEIQDKVIYNQQRFFNNDGYIDDFISKLMGISNAAK